MTILKFEKQIRIETDPKLIQTLQRKGWVIITPPSFNEATQMPPYWNEKTGQWVVENKVFDNTFKIEPEGIYLSTEDRYQSYIAAKLFLLRETKAQKKKSLILTDFEGKEFIVTADRFEAIAALYIEHIFKDEKRG